MPSEILLRNYLGKIGPPKKKKIFKKGLGNESESDSESLSGGVVAIQLDTPRIWDPPE